MVAGGEGRRKRGKRVEENLVKSYVAKRRRRRQVAGVEREEEEWWLVEKGEGNVGRVWKRI